MIHVTMWFDTEEQADQFIVSNPILQQLTDTLTVEKIDHVGKYVIRRDNMRLLLEIPD